MQIDGYFNANDEPAIRLDLGAGAIEILVDTGCVGGLILPTSLAKGLALHTEGIEKFYTATGQPFIAFTYSLEIVWFGRRTKVPVAVSPDVRETLLGGDMLKNCRLTIDYYDRTVTIIRRV
jgi:clan AA aspartic protease